MTALRQPSASADELFPVDAAAPTTGTDPRDSFAYEDDVTPEGIAIVRERVGVLRPKRTYKVIDGYAGDRASAVG